MDDLFERYQGALRLGHQSSAEGRFKEALGHYETAAQLAGERALPHIYVGGMLVRLGQAKEALAAYERALANEPENLDALTGRAAALLALGRRSQAAESQARITELRRGAGAGAGPAPVPNATPMTNADTLMVAGEQARAAGNAEAAIDAWLAEAREHAGGAHFDAALEAAFRALTLGSGAIRVHLELARLYFERGWREQGAERVILLRRLLELSPDQRAAVDLAGLVAEHAPTDERLAPGRGDAAKQPPVA